MNLQDNKAAARFDGRSILHGLIAGQGITISGDPRRPTISAGATGPVTITWEDIQNKPATFAPAAHTQAFTTITGTATAAQIPSLDAGKITTGTFAIARIPTGTTATTVALGNHVHAISGITGLQTALDSKAASVHTHAIADINTLQTELDNIKARLNALETV